MVLVSGISFLGYILVKTVGNKKGISITGLIGGLYSSTATSLSLAQKSKTYPDITVQFITGIIFSCSVSFLKSLIYIRTLNEDLFNRTLIPVLLMFLYLMAVGLFLLLRKRKDKVTHLDDVKTPFELIEALKLGGFITGALLISKIVLSYASVSLYYVVAANELHLRSDDVKDFLMEFNDGNTPTR